MKKICFIFIIITLGFRVDAQNLLWAKSMGGSSGDEARGVAVDNNGNVYTIGLFISGANFDPGVTNFSVTSTGQPGFVTKHDASGNFLWEKSINNVSLSDILIDVNNNILICGSYYGSADFDPGPGVFNMPLTQSTQASFVLTLDNNGNFLWAKGFGDGANAGLYAMTTDNIRNLYFCGSYNNSSGSSDFDPGSATYNLPGNGAFVLKLDSVGNFVLAKSPGNVYAYSIAVDASYNILTTGNFTGTADFDPGAGTYTLTSVFGSSSFGGDIFISKLDQSGNFVWAKKLSSNYSDKATAIVTDGSGNAYITGYFNLGGNTGGYMDLDYPAVGQHTLSSVFWSDCFVAKYDPLGNVVWGKSFGGSGSDDQGYSLVLDPAENIYVTGIFSGTIDFNTGAGPMTSGPNNVFILKMNPSGNSLTVGNIGGFFNAPYNCLAVDYLQHIYLAGAATNYSDLDPETNSYIPYNAGASDAFVLKLGTTYSAGINELKQADGFLLIYPNPSNGLFTIKSKSELRLRLTNNLGQILQTIELNRMNNYEVKTELLSSGIYFLTGAGENQSVKQKIIVKK